MKIIPSKETGDTGSPAPPKSIEQLKAETAPKPRRKRGKKKEPEPIRVPPELIKSGFRVGFNVGYMLTAFEGWKLADDEADELVRAWQPIFDKYIAPNYYEYFMWFTAVGALGSLTFKKTRDYKAYLETQKKKPEKNRIGLADDDTDRS